MARLFNLHHYKDLTGSTDYMDSTDNFSKYIKNRKDVDVNGYYDIIAHGTSTKIQISHRGQKINIDHRTASKLFKRDKNYSGQAIKLLSCSTGKLPNGFAQNLANKLNIPVKAPTDYLWATPSGHYRVSAGVIVNGILIEDKTKKGRFKTFYPGGKFETRNSGE